MMRASRSSRPKEYSNEHEGLFATPAARLHGRREGFPEGLRCGAQDSRRRARRAVRARAGGHAARDFPRDEYPRHRESVVVRLYLREAAVEALFRRARRARRSEEHTSEL